MRVCESARIVRLAHTVLRPALHGAPPSSALCYISNSVHFHVAFKPRLSRGAHDVDADVLNGVGKAVLNVDVLGVIGKAV
jgi:hypothetical protein